MADDNTLRSYRSKDSYRRSANQADAPEPAFGGSDPLAELARLIGQTDPFAETARRQPQPAAPRAAPDDPGDWRRHIQRPNYAEMREEPAFDSDPRYADPRYPDPRYADPDAGYADPDPRYADPGSDPHYTDPNTGYAEHDPYRVAPVEQDRYADPHADYRRDQSYTADYPDEPIHAAAPQHGGYAGSQPPYGDEGYDDPPRRNRGNGLVTAAVLIGCAMLGTAGAYAYRTYATSSGSTQAPVIIADNSPSKIVPANDKKSARSQDRVGGQQGADERLVSREEQPVTLQPPGTAAVPRVVFPSPVQSSPPPTTTGTTPPPAASNAQSSAADQPKRVRTVTIRPEGGDSSARPTGDVPTRAAPPPPARTAAPPPARAPRDQPLSLDPSAPAQVNQPARPQHRALTPPAPRETPAPGPRVASAPASGSGGFLVQVSSQRSESDAQASYRALQGKYSQLKSHPPVIRRADLGSKGVYYRAMVGPFESGEEAVQFCNGLKQAGGQCIIHRN
jgi:hypothetical protein